MELGASWLSQGVCGGGDAPGCPSHPCRAIQRFIFATANQQPTSSQPVSQPEGLKLPLRRTCGAVLLLLLLLVLRNIIVVLVVIVFMLFEYVDAAVVRRQPPMQIKQKRPRSRRVIAVLLNAAPGITIISRQPWNWEELNFHSSTTTGSVVLHILHCRPP